MDVRIAPANNVRSVDMASTVSSSGPYSTVKCGRKYFKDVAADTRRRSAGCDLANAS